MTDEKPLPIPHEVFSEMVQKISAKFAEELQAACEAANNANPDPAMMHSIGIAYLYAMMEVFGSVSAGLELPYIKTIEMVACSIARARDNLSDNEKKIHTFLHDIGAQPLNGDLRVGLLHGEAARQMIERVSGRGKSDIDQMLEQFAIGSHPPKDDGKPN